MDILLIRKELINTMATVGWRFVTDRADAVIKDLMEKALDAEDKATRDELVSEARSARKFWRQMLASLEASKNAEAETEGDWYEVATD